MYRLKAVACYIAFHYVTVALLPEMGGWHIFDDALSGLVRLPASASKGPADGSWSAVCVKGQNGRLQPAICLYERS